MRFEYKRANLSIDGPVTTEELPDFVVLLGPNGSGKSHLLLSLLVGATAVDGITADGGPNSEVRLFELNQLIPTSGGEQAPGQYRDIWSRIRPVVDSLANQFGSTNERGHIEVNREAFNRQAAQQLSMPLAAIEGIQQAAGKGLNEFTNDDYREYFPLHVSASDLFQYSVTEAFLTYFGKWDSNKYQKFLNVNEGVAQAKWLSDDAFRLKYGKPPWTVLDEALEAMGLPYAFIEPTNLPLDVPYEPRLLARDTGVILKLESLSSGEKVLLALALGLYAGDYMKDSVRKPKLLLLDEADASLHPSMIQSLLNVTQKVLCVEHGVRIILATHSPTTVALAPESALYSLSRTGEPRLNRVSREKALSQLTVGIPTLSVRVEDRRQVFVESEKDEARFDAIYLSIKSRLSDCPFTLHFIASGSGGAGSCDAVIQLVRTLRQKGNGSVYGVIDRDTRKASPQHVHFLPGRYSIENYILDPLVLGAFLLRSRIITAVELGLPVETKYFEIVGSHAQSVIDFVYGRVSNQLAGDKTPTQITYLGGFAAQLGVDYLETQGHTLEALLKAAFPALNQFRDLPLEICRTIMNEMTHLIPNDFVNLFTTLATPTTE